MDFAPDAYRTEREKSAVSVQGMLATTNYLLKIDTDQLRQRPEMIAALRMACAPPIARDRLVGLAGVSRSLIETMERESRLPPRMPEQQLDADLTKVAKLISRLADVDIFPWLEERRIPHCDEADRAAMIVADRLCDANADQIIRNAQETRQLKAIETWLIGKGYRNRTGVTDVGKLEPGTFCVRTVIAGEKEDGSAVNMPIDVVIKPRTSTGNEPPLLVEAKSAGDFANTNKRRKEEATKLEQLRRRYGIRVRFVLFLCGYFDRGYLSYEAAEGIDWVWEHRPSDLAEFGL